MIEALKVCHAHRATGKAVLHKDIKPTSIRHKEGHFILASFGLRKVFKHERISDRENAQALAYLPPVSILC